MTFLKSARVKVFFLLIITFIMIFSLIFDSAKVNNTNKPMPVAANGVVDLRNWDFKKDGMLKLNGQWEFYNGEFLTPQDFISKETQNKSYVTIPGKYANFGHGTLRLKLHVKEPNEIGAIKIEFLQDAYKLWANDEEIMSAGVVGKSKGELKPRVAPKTGTFAADKGEVYLTLQVSNYSSSSGVIDTIVVGDSFSIDRQVKQRLAFDLFLFGCTLMAALYSLALFVKRRKNVSTLYSAIICLIVAIRTIFLGERFVYYIFPDFNHNVSVKIMLLTFYLYIPFIVLFIQNFYNEILPKWVVKTSTLSAYVYALLILFIPSMHYTKIILPFEMLCILLLIYMVYKAAKLCINNNSSDYIIVVGLFALLLTRINDILYEYSIIITGTFAQLGVLIFILANSYLLAGRQAIAVNNAEAVNEKLKSLNNLKDEFLAITSHELKTPLNGIIGLSEILNNSSTSAFNEEDKQNLSMINLSAKRLSNLVNDIMVLSKLKNDDIKLQKKTIYVEKIAEAVVKFCSVNINNKNIFIENLIDSKVPAVFGDKDRIEQIFFNLVGNAIKFTSQGNIKLYYAVKDNFIEIYIEDTGIGIPKNKINSIFQIYEQVDGISEKYGGAGLGLYITRKLIELHGGTIGVTSVVGKGSIFKFTLPICKVGDKREDENLEDEIKTLIPLSTKSSINSTVDGYAIEDGALPLDEKKRGKILIVDDEYVNRRVLEGYLSKENFITLKASSGREALKVIEENKDLDLVILDMMMPDLLGNEVSSITRKNRSLFELPILIMTANSNLDNLVSAFQCGANDYLTKPFNQLELLVRVNTLIHLKQSAESALRLTMQMCQAKEKVEELREYNKLKTELFTNLSHELRTPLNVITSSIQLLDSLDGSKSLGDEKIKYYLGIMNQNSLRLLRLINNIIDMTKAEGDFLTLNLTNGDIVFTIEEVCQSVAEYIKAQNIAIIFDTELEEKVIAFDEEKLERVILNLLSNAVKFTNKGGNIFVNIYDRKDCIEISVRDTGIGIPKDKLEFIFQRFAQLDKSLSRKNEGSGIGLSLVKSIVEMHGGKITAVSELGVGTEFIIKLPIISASENAYEDRIIQDKESRFEKNLHMEFSDIYM